MKARTKSYIIKKISNNSGTSQCYIHCYPQQKWSCSFVGNEVHLTYKHLDLCIERSEFDTYWMIIE